MNTHEFCNSFTLRVSIDLERIEQDKEEVEDEEEHYRDIWDYFMVNKPF